MGLGKDMKGMESESLLGDLVMSSSSLFQKSQSQTTQHRGFTFVKYFGFEMFVEHDMRINEHIERERERARKKSMLFWLGNGINGREC